MYRWKKGAVYKAGKIIENRSDYHQKNVQLFYSKEKKAFKSYPGPLVCFEGLLSLYGNEVKMVNDMIVAVEDLRSVEFTLMPVEKKRTGKKAAAAKSRGGGGNAVKPGDGPATNSQGGGTTVRQGTESKFKLWLTQDSFLTSFTNR